MKKVSLWVGPNRFITHIEEDELEFIEQYISSNAGMESVWFDCREHTEMARNDDLEIRVRASSVKAYRVLGDV